MGRVIAVANHKGGVGKTTTAVTLATAAADYGRRALLVDLDPQAQCAVSLGVARLPGVYAVAWEGAPLDRNVIEARPGCDLLPGTRESTSGLQDSMVGDPLGVYVLAEVLNSGAGYDLVFIDCPPTLGRLNMAAMLAASGILIPVQCNYLGLESLGQFLGEFDRAKRRRGGPTAEVIAIVPTFFDVRTNASKETKAELDRLFGALVAEAIPAATAVERATEEGRTIWEACPESPATARYRLLADWLYGEVAK